MKILSRLETDGFSRGDRDFGAGAWVASDARLARLDGEDAESAELNAVSFGERLLHGFEDRVYGGFGLGADEAGALDDSLDEVLFDQTDSLSCVLWQRGVGCPESRCDAGQGCKAMVETAGSNVNRIAANGNGTLHLGWENATAGCAGRVQSMSIKSDRWIREQAVEHGMISPFSEKQVKDGCISYGLSSYGYDLRVSDEFKIFTNVNSAIIDPKAFDERSFVSVQADTIIVPPNSFALARSVEYFKIPRDVLTICVGKSTYARCGIIVNVTPFEPEWEGYVTLEISNTTPLPARIYANEGLCQILFFQSDEVCEVSYADRKGKYQNQQGIVLPKL